MVWNSVTISESSSRMKVSILQDIVIKQTRRKEGHKKKDGRAEGRRCLEGEQESKAEEWVG